MVVTLSRWVRKVHEKRKDGKGIQGINSGMKTRKQNEEEKQNKWLLQHDRCESLAFDKDCGCLEERCAAVLHGLRE